MDASNAPVIKCTDRPPQRASQSAPRRTDGWLCVGEGRRQVAAPQWTAPTRTLDPPTGREPGGARPARQTRSWRSGSGHVDSPSCIVPPPERTSMCGVLSCCGWRRPCRRVAGGAACRRWSWVGPARRQWRVMTPLAPWWGRPSNSQPRTSSPPSHWLPLKPPSARRVARERVHSSGRMADGGWCRWLVPAWPGTGGRLDTAASPGQWAGGRGPAQGAG
jgi:hypothetical protein